MAPRSNNVELDFTNVEERKARTPRQWVTEGDYKFKIDAIDPNAISSNKLPMWIVTLSFLEGPAKGKQHTDWLSLTPQALFKLRDLLEAIGLKVSGKKAKFDPQKLVGKVVGAHIRDADPYKGKVNSEVAYYLPADNVGDVPEDDDAVDAAADEDDVPEGDDTADEVETDEFDLNSI